MATLSFHADPILEKRIRSAARKRGLPVSRFLQDAIRRSLDGPGLKGADVRGVVAGKSHLKPGETALPPWREDDPLFR